MKPDAPTLQFRSLFRRYTTGVALIGVRGVEHPIGMTVNSLTPVSLDPPLLLFCAKHESKTANRIVEVGQFSVNLLTADQETASRHYAGASGAVSAGEWRDVQSCPWLEDSNGVFLCRLNASFPGGDHRILVGRVEEMRGPDTPAIPLLYHGGRYTKFAFPDGVLPEPNWENLWWTG